MCVFDVFFCCCLGCFEEGNCEKEKAEAMGWIIFFLYVGEKKMETGGARELALVSAGPAPQHAGSSRLVENDRKKGEGIIMV